MICSECDVVKGGGPFILETPLFVAHALRGPSPLAGWAVIAPKRHAGWWWEPTDDESRELGPLAKKILLAQRRALGAVHGYAFAIGDVLHHMHLHLVPRYADTPKALWGRGAFDAKPDQHQSEEKILLAVRALSAELNA